MDSTKDNDREEFIKICYDIYNGRYLGITPIIEFNVIEYYCLLNGKDKKLIDEFNKYLFLDGILFRDVFLYCFQKLLEYHNITIVINKGEVVYIY